MALTDWGLGRFEGAFKSCERQLQRQRLPLALGAVKALEALETAWAQYCQACRTFEALYVDVNLSNVSKRIFISNVLIFGSAGLDH